MYVVYQMILGSAVRPRRLIQSFHGKLFGRESGIIRGFFCSIRASQGLGRRLRSTKDESRECHGKSLERVSKGGYGDTVVEATLFIANGYLKLEFDCAYMCRD